jgi:hypothetical protein
MATITTEPDYFVFNGGTSADLQLAIDNAIAAGKSLFLVPPAPPASSVFTAENLTITNSVRPFKLFATPGSVTLKLSKSADAILTIQGSNDIEVSGINFDASFVFGATNPITTVWGAIRVATSNRIRIEKCKVFAVSKVGIFFDKCGTSQSAAVNPPYGSPVTFDNIAGSIELCEIYSTFS